MSTSPLGLPVLPYPFRRSVISIMCHHDEPSPLSYEMTPSSPGRIPCCQVSISSSFEICGQRMALLFPFFYVNLPMSLCLWLLHCCFVWVFWRQHTGGPCCSVPSEKSVFQSICLDERRRTELLVVMEMFSI